MLQDSSQVVIKPEKQLQWYNIVPDWLGKGCNKMTPRKSSNVEPRILEMSQQKMAVVQSKGTPDKVFPEVLPALYGSVYTLKFDLKKKGAPTFKVSGLRARYPDANLVPKEAVTYLIGLPIPEDTAPYPYQIPSEENKEGVSLDLPGQLIQHISGCYRK
ncbi:MAG: hypothetical protein JW732_02595 [Dehalococcoidia bacterium]|nr:hypothetical protein [Dehalococcoidia bacterium]